MAIEETDRFNADVRRKLLLLADKLGYSGREGFILKSGLHTAPSYRHALSQAFTDMSVVGCYGFMGEGAQSTKRFTPLVYLAVAESLSHADSIHRIVWSQGIVPLLLIGTPDGVQVRIGLRYRSGDRHQLSSWNDALVAGKLLPRELSPFSALSLSGSVGWRDFAPKPAERVDSRLLDGITSLSRALQERFDPLRDRPDLINALVGRMIYLYVLIDRKIIDQKWVDGLRKESGERACPTLEIDGPDGSGATTPDKFWDSDEVWRLFDCIDEVLNGAIFPIDTADRNILSTEVIHFTRRVIRFQDVVTPAAHQYSFFDVSFSALRTETVSAIYELFLSLEDSDSKAALGAFYTPPYLVDYMLDEVDAIQPLNTKARILDPAAGSGVFLVGAYRRILERSMPKRGWGKKDLPELKELLTRCIYGIETNPQAINVARFSLYLTLLDYLNGLSLEEINEALGGDRLFPTLDTNLLCRDFFSSDPTPPEFPSEFTHVLGNPPWAELDKTADTPANKYRATLSAKTFPVDHNRLAELFVWRAIKDVVQPLGVIGLLLSTKCFISPGATKFPEAVARSVSVVGITNLWHFRYRLFKSARNPATAFFAKAEPPDPNNSVWIYAPLLTSQPIAVDGHPWAIIADRGDVTHFRLRDISASSDTWFHALMLQPFDRRNARIVTERARNSERTLGDFVKRSGMHVGRGGSPRQTGLPNQYLLGTDVKDKEHFYRFRLGLDGMWDSSYVLPAQLRDGLPGNFKKLFGGDALLISRNLKHFDLVEQPIAFGSSLNAIVYQGKSVTSREQRLRGLQGLSAFLKSEIAEYLFALFGRMWLLDGRRFEKKDLLKIPVPFSDFKDPMLWSIPNLKQSDITALFVNCFSLDQWFADAVDEFIDFRKGYQDAQVPRNAFSKPPPETRNHYVDVLNSYLMLSFGNDANISINRQPQEDDSFFEKLTITIGVLDESEPSQGAASIDEINLIPEPNYPTSAFNDSGEVRFDPERSRIDLVKPLTHAAWTTERAYADSIRIIEEVANS